MFNTMAMTLDEQINQALEVLRRGESSSIPPIRFGVSVRCDESGSGRENICTEKERNKKSMLVLLDQIEKVSLYIQKVPDVAWQLYEVADKPLTLILPEARGVAANLIPEEGTLGIRIADHEFCKRLIRKLRKPLVSTSANITGQPTPATFSEISKEIVDGVDLVIDPQFDEHPTHKVSSILMVGIDGEIKIIRA